MSLLRNLGPRSEADTFAVPVAANSTVFPSWAVTVTVSTPLWFYCRQGTHCVQGMGFAINPVRVFLSQDSETSPTPIHSLPKATPSTPSSSLRKARPQLLPPGLRPRRPSGPGRASQVRLFFSSLRAKLETDGRSPASCFLYRRVAGRTSSGNVGDHDHPRAGYHRRGIGSREAGNGDRACCSGSSVRDGRLRET